MTRASGPPPQPTRRNVLFDVALALALAFVAAKFGSDGPVIDSPGIVVIDGMPPPPPPPTPFEPGVFEPKVVEPGGLDEGDAQAIFTALIAAVALAFRRRYPLSVMWVVLLTTVLVVSNEPRLTFYAAVIAAYTVAAYSQYRVPALVSVALTGLALTADSNEAIPIVPIEFVPLLVLVPIVVAADGMRRWRLREEQSRAKVSELEREQAEAVRQGAEEERARIARELHDVVTHNVSVMVIQAGAARKVMATDPGQASEALLAVESGGRAAMAELRQAMGLLSRDDDGDPDLSPQPGLEQLEALIERVREAGVTVELEVTGQVRGLPSGVELTAYRVVQEALTNTMKHAPRASAHVTVEYGDDQVRVEVVDFGGTAVGDVTGSDAGRGLMGLRERLAVHDGTLQSGPRLTGGYRVEAIIPVEAS
jgi:signal transduction histidine kinase